MARRKRKKVQHTPRRVGRPRKRIDVTAVRARLLNGESLRSVSRALMVSHSTLLAHLRRAGLVDEINRRASWNLQSPLCHRS
jgi:DNA-binding transcriptional ArsR family regulator